MLYSPNDHHGNKFLGSWNKLINLQNMLFWEEKEKYSNEFNARFNSRLEIGSLPRCFDHCIQDVEAAGGLTSDEKNCVRECYLKRVSARDDMNMHFQQRVALDSLRGMKDNLV